MKLESIKLCHIFQRGILQLDIVNILGGNSWDDNSHSNSYFSTIKPICFFLQYFCCGSETMMHPSISYVLNWQVLKLLHYCVIKVYRNSLLCLSVASSATRWTISFLYIQMILTFSTFYYGMALSLGCIISCVEFECCITFWNVACELSVSQWQCHSLSGWLPVCWECNLWMETTVPQKRKRLKIWQRSINSPEWPTCPLQMAQG